MKRLILIMLVLLILPLTASAQTIGLRDVIQALENPFKPDAQLTRGTATSGIFDFQADFFQESHIAAIDRVQRGRGDVSFKFDRSKSSRAPVSMFRWEYREPSTQEIVSDGRTMWVYLPENRQVIESDMAFVSRQQGDNPVTFLTGLGNLSRDFLIKWAVPNHDSDGNYVLELRPRKVSQLIQRLEIVVDRDAVLEFVNNNTVGEIFPILATTVVDPNGNRTVIEFHDIRINRGMSDAFYRFIRPAGVEVVRPSGEEMGF